MSFRHRSTSNRKRFSDTRVSDAILFEIKMIEESDGILVPIESNSDIPFDIKRLFYVTKVPVGEVRGEHSHFITEQVLTVPNGTLSVLLDDGFEKKTFLLDSPNKALYIPYGIWDSAVYESEDTILLAMSNIEYRREDYIVDYDEFKRLKGVQDETIRN